MQPAPRKRTTTLEEEERDRANFRDYCEQAEQRALKLNNRGPVRFDADGNLAKDIMDAYWETGFYVFEKVFAEAKGQDAVLVFDEAEGLFATRTNEGGSTSRHDSMNVGILLHHMEEFSGIVVAITNRYAQVDTAFHRRFKFIMEFPTPDAATRSKLWRMLIPAAAPLAKDVNFDELGQRFEISGGHIKSGARNAAHTHANTHHNALHRHPITHGR